MPLHQAMSDCKYMHTCVVARIAVPYCETEQHYWCSDRLGFPLLRPDPQGRQRLPMERSLCCSNLLRRTSYFLLPSALISQGFALCMELRVSLRADHNKGNEVQGCEGFEFLRSRRQEPGLVRRSSVWRGFLSDPLSLKISKFSIRTDATQSPRKCAQSFTTIPLEF